MLLEHSEHPIVRIEGVPAYFGTGGAPVADPEVRNSVESPDS